MSFETIGPLLTLLETGVLLAILFRLSSTFELIANTQRELRRAIHHLGERRSAELGTTNPFGLSYIPFGSCFPQAPRCCEHDWTQPIHSSMAVSRAV
jgi:hypothetical protein